MVFNFPNIDYTYIFVKYGVPPTPFSQEKYKPNTNSNQINPCAVVSKAHARFHKTGVILI